LKGSSKGELEEKIMILQKRPKIGVIVGDRGFFPRHLIASGRETILKVLASENIDPVILDPQETASGGIESLSDAQKCGALFRAHSEELDGFLVTLPNFGDEKAVANSLRFSGLHLPVLVHAFNDDQQRMSGEHRRDSFCGKISACNNLKQYGIPFTLTSLHTMDPEGEEFKRDLRSFLATCRVYNGLKRVRVGAIGARPTAFNTVRYSEKILELNGISVETLDLSEVVGQCTALNDSDGLVINAKKEINDYADAKNVPAASLTKMAKLKTVIERWMTENDLEVLSLQCWTALETYFGITPCAVMSMMSDRLVSSACETDVAGALSMHALSLASLEPGMLLDWNNNYGKENDKAVVFHCGNIPGGALTEKPLIRFSEIFAGSVGAENAYGTLAGRIKPQPFTYCRLSTDDMTGTVKAYVGEGRFTSDPLDTFGNYGVVEVPKLQDLLAYICNETFEHHVAATLSRVAGPIHEAMSKYLRWSIYKHGN
jgi:L-fucose isomerase-like protein